VVEGSPELDATPLVAAAVKKRASGFLRWTVERTQGRAMNGASELAYRTVVAPPVSRGSSVITRESALPVACQYSEAPALTSVP